MRAPIVVGPLLAAAILAAATPAAAASCTLVNVLPVRFGRYDPLALRGAESDGRIMFLCRNARPTDGVTIWLDAGLGASGGWSRRMTSGPNRLGYQLYLDAARTQIWGDGTGGSGAWSSTGPLPNGAVRIPVYGHIPAGQYVGSGTYRDTVTVTVVF